MKSGKRVLLRYLVTLPLRGSTGPMLAMITIHSRSFKWSAHTTSFRGVEEI